jgi:hypothetical protein
MEYNKLKNTWGGLKSYDLNGKVKENYTGPVTMSLPEWQQYVASGNNVLLGSGGVIPGPVLGTGWTGQSVYGGHVRQGYR